MDKLLQQPLHSCGGNAESEAFLFINQRSNAKKHLVRKTSAEIVSEAKNMLAGGGTRLVSARRPITPRESRRQLYGRIAPPGRPPSAINLKCLLQTTHVLPILEPIKTCYVTRAQSFDGTVAVEGRRYSSGGCSDTVLSAPKEKLPALVGHHKMTGSLGNLADYKTFEYKPASPQGVPTSFKGLVSEISTGSSIVRHYALQRQLALPFEAATTSTEQRNNAVDDSKMFLGRSNVQFIQLPTESLLDMLKPYSGLKDYDDNTIAYVNAMNVTGSNLTGACKIVFKIARNERNDNLFVDSDLPELLVDGLGRASPIDDSEACIYGYGAIRFLAGSSNGTSKDMQKENSATGSVSSQRSLVLRLIAHGLYQLMVLHLKIINEEASSRQLSGSPLHALFQLSGALRILAGSHLLNNCYTTDHKHLLDPPTGEGDEEQHDLPCEQAVPLLVRAAEMCIDEPEVQANIVRTLSVLSEHSKCCKRLADCAPRLGILLGSVTQMSAMPENALATTNRLGYILGNVMSAWDIARVQFHCCDVSLDALLLTLEYYEKKSLILRNQMGDSVVQVLTKLIRIVANMCVNGDVGYSMSERTPLGELLLKILIKVKEPQSLEMEELLFATLGALHNLSYYCEFNATSTVRNAGSICERLKDICGALCSILKSEQNPARSEVARVMGNMTRTASIRQTFFEKNGMEILRRCLSSTNDELIVTSCGVMVNMLGDWSRRISFHDIDGLELLRCILQRGIGNRDWIMAGIACQAIWNYLIDISDIIKVLDQSAINLICEHLAEALDEDILFGGKEPDSYWNDFALVGTDLLERLQLCMSGQNTPCEKLIDAPSNVDGVQQYWQDTL